MDLQANRLAATQERLDLLQAVAGTEVGTKSLEAVLERHAKGVCRVLGADFCILRQIQGQELHLLAACGIDKSQLELKLDCSLGIGKLLIDTKKPVGVKDTHNHHAATPALQIPKRVDFVSYAGTPMICNDQVVGIMAVYCKTEQRDFSTDDLDLLYALGNNLAVAIANHELFLELKTLNEELDERVKNRTAELEAANRELEAFTYTVAHDLRTPLRAIVSNSQILLEDFADEIPLEAKPMLERQTVSAKRLATMMDGLLALTRIGKHDIQKVRMNLSRMAEEVALEFIRAHPKNPPSFHIEPDILIAGDSRLIRMLLQNLFENSVKFVKESERAVVRVRSDSSDESISFIVEDEGIGFEMEYAEKVFQPFERLVREDAYPGTGIGLASVKRIVDKHRGLVQVKSRPGEGTAFEFRL